MTSKTNIYSDEWCDLVFESKNQAYGAYLQRKKSANRHLVSLISGSIIFILVVSAPVLLKQIMPKKKETDLTVRMLSDIKIEKPVENADILKEVPPPPPLRNTIKFTPPIIKPDDEVNEEEQPKLQEEVVDNKSAIGSVDFDEGTDDVEAPMPTENKVIAEEVETPFVIVEQMPEFPGGQEAMMKYIFSKLNYPAQARRMQISGKVFIKFVIGPTGTVSNVQVIRGIGGGCDEEAVRVISGMPKWNPGKQGGRAVSVFFTLPITFKLQ